jgi:hypothetical protein
MSLVRARTVTVTVTVTVPGPAGSESAGELAAMVLMNITSLSIPADLEHDLPGCS